MLRQDWPDAAMSKIIFTTGAVFSSGTSWSVVRSAFL